MCDCYIAKCATGCGTQLSIHIGDFSADREEVSVLCPACVDSLINVDAIATRTGVIIDRVSAPMQVTREGQVYDNQPQPDKWQIACVGQPVVIFCSNKAGHGIHLN